MITFRRKYLDQFLDDHQNQFRGIVLDIGGEKYNNRSSFTPPIDKAESWTIINIDEATGADLTAPADNIPLNDFNADCILMTELLEHVPNPEAVLKEATRLLKNKGTLYVTMPFLYQVHGDPDDYTRWTADMLELKAKEAGLEVVSLEPMGGLYAVIYDLIRAHLYRTGTPGALGFRIKLKTLSILAPLFGWLDRKITASRPHITTGWAMIAKKG